MNKIYIITLDVIVFIYVCNNYVKCDSALRVIGGRDALKDEFPFVLRIEIRETQVTNGKNVYNYQQLCTGTALTASWILSAAHCDTQQYFKPDVTEILVARYNSFYPKILGSVSPIFDAKLHPAYTHKYDDISNEYSFKNDLCLFRSQNIMVSRYGKISAVNYMTLVGHEAYTLGHGGTNATPSQTPLQVLKGMLNECTKDDYFIVSMICLVPPCGVEATICGGDSGGPVVHSSGIIGVNSMSAADCDEYTTSLELYPGSSASIIAVVSPIIDWISNVIANKTAN